MERGFAWISRELEGSGSRFTDLLTGLTVGINPDMGHAAACKECRSHTGMSKLLLV